MDEPTTGTGEAEEAEVGTDAEQVESEWHAWVAGIAVALGGVLLVARDYLIPELLLGLGPVFIAIGVAGGFIQWIYERRR